jgi:bifunctional NMN adenylyltransferase/nudix hydrolase
MDYDLAVIIGRFHILHEGQMHVFNHALERAEKLLILVGSAYAAPSLRNPFSSLERCIFINDALHNVGIDSDRVICTSLEDHVYDDDKWKKTVR